MSNHLIDPEACCFGNAPTHAFCECGRQVGDHVWGHPHHIYSKAESGCSGLRIVYDDHYYRMRDDAITRAVAEALTGEEILF